MSLPGFSAPIRIDSAVSPRLAGIVCALQLVAGAAVFALALPFALRLLMLVVLAAFAYDALRILLLRAGRRSIVRVELARDNTWRLTDGRGDDFVAHLLRDSRLSVPLLALRWRDGRGRRRRAFLVADAGDPQSLRRLRVRLRFAADDLLESPGGTGSQKHEWPSGDANFPVRGRSMKVAKEPAGPQ